MTKLYNFIIQLERKKENETNTEHRSRRHLFYTL